MACVDTFIKRKVGSVWVTCENSVLRKGDIIRIYERNRLGGYTTKQVGGMDFFILLADARPGCILLGAWLDNDTLRFLEDEERGSK